MIRKFLERLEDPKRRLLGPTIRIMTWMGVILPENIFSKVAYIFVHELFSFFVITQLMEIYVVKSDLNQIIENIKVSIFSVIGVLKLNSMLLGQKRWKQVVAYVTEADEYERVNQDKIRAEIIDKYTKHCRRLTYSYWVLLFVTFLAAMFTPLMTFKSSQNFRQGLHNGSEQFPHICSSWMPMDKNQSPGSWITVIWQIFACMYYGFFAAAYDTNMIVIMSFFGGKLELLRERAKLILGTPGNRISDDETKEMIRHLHHDHVLLMKYSKLFNSLLSPIMFCYVALCSLNLCAISYQITSASNLSRKLFLTVYLLFGTSQLFMYCWQSTDVLNKGEQLMLGPYESEWWAANAKQRRDVLMMAGQFQIKPVFTVGPFTSLSLSTFITILKGAYSYYTLLRQ